MPEHAQLSSIRVNPLQGSDGVVRAQVLMIFGDKLDESTCASMKSVKFSMRSSSRS